jgi:protein phosphatase
MVTQQRIHEARTMTVGARQLFIAGVSDRGTVRAENQDRFAVVPLENMAACALLLADGMGGHTHGGEAAGLALDAATAALQSGTVPGAAFAEGFVQADAAVGRMQAAGSSGRDVSGTTLVGAILCDEDVRVGNVGDSRAYLASGGGVTLISRDHTLASDAVFAGTASSDDAARLPGAGSLTRAITGSGDAPDMFDLSMGDGDTLMLCSDGLWGVLDAKQLFDALRADLDPLAIAVSLCDEALRAGSRDNVSVVVCRSVTPAT